MKKISLMFMPNGLRKYLEERFVLNSNEYFTASDVPKNVLKSYFELKFDKALIREFEKGRSLALGFEYVEPPFPDKLKEKAGDCFHIFSTPGNIIIYPKDPDMALAYLQQVRLRKAFDSLREDEKSTLICAHENFSKKIFPDFYTCLLSSGFKEDIAPCSGAYNIFQKMEDQSRIVCKK